MNPALLDLIRMREKTDVKKTTDIDVTEWKKEETSRKMQSADRYKKEIHAFLEQIKCDYLEVGMGEKNTLFKLKELWAYMGQNAPEEKKALKRIRNLRVWQITTVPAGKRWKISYFFNCICCRKEVQLTSCRIEEFSVKVQ